MVHPVMPDRWYWRLSLNQEGQLKTAIGECKGMHYDAAIKALEEAKRPDLVKVVQVAAAKAGCTPPLPQETRPIPNFIPNFAPRQVESAD